MQMVEADHAMRGIELTRRHEFHALRLLQDRVEVDIRILIEVDLAVDERRHGGLRVRYPHELYAIDAGELGTSEALSLLARGSRHIVGVFEVNRFAARYPLVLGNLEGTGAISTLHSL